MGRVSRRGLDLQFENYAYGGALTDNANLFDEFVASTSPVCVTRSMRTHNGPMASIGAHLRGLGRANDFRAALSKGQTPESRR